MSWPGTDFEVEIQNELDELRARNKLLENVAAAARACFKDVSRAQYTWTSLEKALTELDKKRDE